MNSYIVLYRIKSIMCDSDDPFGFQCFADDKMHADEQCQNAYPDCDVVYVYEASSLAQGQYTLALSHYYR